MVTINPSLMFTGACGDAFGATHHVRREIVMMLTYAESPLQQQSRKIGATKSVRALAPELDITGGAWPAKNLALSLSSGLRPPTDRCVHRAGGRWRGAHAAADDALVARATACPQSVPGSGEIGCERGTTAQSPGARRVAAS